MTVRAATVEDGAEVIEMARHFYAQTVYSKSIPYDEETAMERFLDSIEQNMCFVSESDGEISGFILGFLAPSLMNKNYQIGCELAWWVKPEYRGSLSAGKLIKAIEKGAKDRGAKIWSMVSLANLNPEVAEKFYLNSGYEHTESTFSRVH